MKRIAIYIHHARSGEWEMWQPKMLQDYVCKQGGTVVGSYIEIGYVGQNRLRPHLERLLIECESGNVDEVLILNVSHLSRNTYEFIKIYERLKKCNVCLSVMQLGTSKNVDETMTLLKVVSYGT